MITSRFRKQTSRRSYRERFTMIEVGIFKQFMGVAPGYYEFGNASEESQKQYVEVREPVNGDLDVVLHTGQICFELLFRLVCSSTGKRLYIICPHCDKKRQHLYIVRQRTGCGQCFDLSYKSQSEDINVRLLMKILNHRIKIWGSHWPDVNNLRVTSRGWFKPSGMHTSKFVKLTEQLNKLEDKFYETTRKKWRERE